MRIKLLTYRGFEISVDIKTNRFGNRKIEGFTYTYTPYSLSTGNRWWVPIRVFKGLQHLETHILNVKRRIDRDIAKLKSDNEFIQEIRNKANYKTYKKEDPTLDGLNYFRRDILTTPKIIKEKRDDN